jgi:3-polyprenyl-4-hydroxybenzoate decarboxylase
MQENFRQFLDRLRQEGELVDLHQPVDIRHIATLTDQRGRMCVRGSAFAAKPPQ